MLTSATFKAMGTLNTVAVAEREMLEAAVAIVRDEIDAIDRVCSRFRPESELSRLNVVAGHGPVAVSELLQEGLEAGLRAAEMTGGLVDPTVGKNVEDAGYDVTFTAVPPDGPPIALTLREVQGWRSVRLDHRRHTVAIPGGVAIDLGASGKAWAADRAAGAAAAALGIAVLVECGGDVAVRGIAPGGGWPVRVTLDMNAGCWQDVLVRDGGLATSGTTARRWRRGGVEMHDIIDPRTGRPAETPWAMVTVAAATCLEANAAATAAVILGLAAIEWLDRLGLPTRLLSHDGRLTTAGGWAA